MIARFFINRPVLANVIAILMMLLGAIAAYNLPVSEYPNVVPPTVQVTTSFPNADPRTVMNTVALPIEEQVNGVDHMLYMQSESAGDGSYSLTVTFDIGTDPDRDTELVQSRVNAALASLPGEVQAEGVSVQKRSSNIQEIITLNSVGDRLSDLALTNYAVLHLQEPLARLPGVGGVKVFGSSPFAMRIWLRPRKMQQFGISVQDVINAVHAQNLQVAGGQLGGPPAAVGSSRQYPLLVNGALHDPAGFAAIVVKTPGGAGARLVRLGDIARVDLGANSYNFIFKVDGRPSAGLAIFLTPGANALTVAHEVKTTLAQLAARFPPGVKASIPFDTTKFIAASIHEVYTTLAIAAVLVLLVIVVFLQDWRAMLVPATTVPVTIIGTFAAIAALGFSINLSTLFAIVLAIGIVVDDAIIVVEAASIHMADGKAGPEAAGLAMDELTGPILGITLVLVSVFLPAAFLPGLTGRMYAQFSLVIAAAAVISAINAMTLKPTQCAWSLRPPVPLEQRAAPYRLFNRIYQRMEDGFTGLVGWMLPRSGLFCLLALLLIVLGAVGFALLPSSFIPVEDQGYFILSAQLPSGTALARTESVLAEMKTRILAVPGVEHVITVAGISPQDNNATLPNAGLIYVILKDWSERGAAEGLLPTYTRLQAIAAATPAADILVVPPPPIQGIGNGNGFTLEAEDRAGSTDFAALGSYTHAILAHGAASADVGRIFTSYRDDGPQLRVTVDRDKAAALQVSLGTATSAINAVVASTYLGQFVDFGQVYQVVMQGDETARNNAAALDSLPVQSETGSFVPLGSIAKVTRTAGPPLITLYDLYPAATITGTPGATASSGQALDAVEAVARRYAPPGFGYDWTAMSYQQRIVGGQIFLVFGLAMLLVYLVLAALYESWLLPVAVLLAVPLTLLGPVGVFWLVGAPVNLYVEIGLILLIALSAKNAILVIEVAREARLHDCLSVIDAAIAGVRRRFRPILMTSIAFAFGVLPLVLATGAGANARKSIGITAFSGMIASTVLAVVFVPCFFVVLQRFAESRRVQ